MYTEYKKDILKQLQEVELGILLAIDYVCQKNNLIYFIDGGTLLGAVRHGGFIPWDDDIDIGMPHEDYLKFLEIAPNDLPAEYEINTPENTPNQSALWTKVTKRNTRFIDTEAHEGGYEQGIFVDVFDYRQFDKNPHVKNRQIKRSVFWQRISYLQNTAHLSIPGSTKMLPLVKAGLAVAHLCAKKLFTKTKVVNSFDQAWKSTNPGEYWMNASYAYKIPYSSDVLFPVKPIEFCGESVMAPNNPTQYLESLYGDYMRFPPENERHNHLPTILDFGDGINVMQDRLDA